MHQFIHHGMADDMVDPVERLAERNRQSLGCGNAHGERAHQSRPRCHCDGIDVVERHLRLVQSGFESGHKGLEMCPGSHLRHDPTKPGMLIHG